MKYIDLHVHSSFSDGSYTPSELVNYAISKNLSAFALTDHDTTDGISEAFEEANRVNKAAGKEIIKIIPGIELSAEHNSKDIHILGLNIDYKNERFNKQVAIYRKSREDRNEKMIECLQRNGFNITPQMLKEHFGNAVITRAHYAILMVEAGYVSDKNEAFDKFLNPGCPCYIPRMKVSVTEAVKIILDANGKPVLAHPLLYHLSDEELNSLVNLLKENGLQGIEAIYSSNTGNDEARMKSLADKYNLFITGGTDFHGIAKPSLDLGTGYGNIKIPEELLNNII
jgi:predicted metal-dependent phosphoesterase TrpH